MTDIKGNKERFLSILKSVENKGDIDKLIKWLETSDFFTAPASSRFHGSYEGGLCEHSLNVFDEMIRLNEAYKITAANDSIAICSLLHDLCKVNYYKKEKRNRKNEQGIWEQYDAYTTDELFKFGGHGSKSVFIILQFIKLLPEEAAAINCHMGAFDNPNAGLVYESNHLAWLLHVADEAATYIIESDKTAKVL